MTAPDVFKAVNSLHLRPFSSLQGGHACTSAHWLKLKKDEQKQLRSFSFTLTYPRHLLSCIHSAIFDASPPLSRGT